MDKRLGAARRALSAARRRAHLIQVKGPAISGLSPPPSFLFPCKCMCAQKARPARSGGPDARTVGGWQLAVATATTEEQYVCTGFSCWDVAFVKPNRLCPTFLRLGMQYACFSLEASLIIPTHRCFTFVQQTNHQSVSESESGFPCSLM